MIVKILREQLLHLQNPTFALWQQNYLRNQFPFLGVKVPLLRIVMKQLQKNFPSSDWKEETRCLMNENEREFHHAAVLWAIQHRSHATQEDFPFYEKLITLNSWWDTVDTIAPHLVGALVKRYPELIVEVEKWLNSPNLWLKRSAIIYPLFQRKNMSQIHLFTSCAHLREEKDFFIRKAIGWVLREHGKYQPEAVAQFLATTKLSPLSEREARKHLQQLSN